MATVSIPQKRLESVRLIARLGDEAVKQLFAAMARQPASLFLTGAAKNIAAEVSLIPPDDVLEIVDSLLSMYPAMISSCKHVGEFAADLANSVSGKKDWTTEDVKQLQVNLETLLRVPSISLGAKATNLLFQNERSLINSRVITDMRPVFELDSDEVGGGIVIHTLKLEYIADQSDDQQSFSVSLDLHDIDQMIENLERAKRKGEKLRTLVSAASIPVIDEDEK